MFVSLEGSENWYSTVFILKYSFCREYSHDAQEQKIKVFTAKAQVDVTVL